MKMLELCFPLSPDAFPRSRNIQREMSGAKAGGGEDSMERQSSVTSKPAFQPCNEGSSILSHMSLPG